MVQTLHQPIWRVVTVVVVGCDENGNIDIADLKAKAEKHQAELLCDGDLSFNPRCLREEWVYVKFVRSFINMADRFILMAPI